MLRNIFLKTLGDNRWGILGVGLGLALILLAGVTQYPVLINGTGAARAAQVAEFTKLLKAYSFLLGTVVPIDTVGGFLTVRILGTVPVLLGLWAAIVAAGLIRGEEELGALDVLLTTPHGRLSVFWQKTAALGLGLAIVLLLVGGGTLAGVAAINDTMPPSAVLGLLINVGAITAFWSALALLVSQLVAARRTASTVVGGLIFATYLLNNILGGLPGWQGLTWLLPFHYYALSTPLVPGHTLDLGPWTALVCGAGVLFGLASAIFARRDLGGVFALLPTRRTPRARGSSPALLGSVFAKSLRDLGGATLGWGIGLALYGAVIVATTNESLAPMRDALHNLPWLGAIIGDVTSNASYLSAAMFSSLPLILTFFALLQIASWTGDEESGRLELLVAEPLQRLRILLARYAAVVCSLLGVLVLAGAGILATAALTDTPVPADRVALALAAVGVITLLVLAFGLAVATWLRQPGAAVPLTGGLAITMYFLDLLAALFHWPEAVRNLSIYHLFGRPLLDGLGGGNLVLLVAALLLAGASLTGFARRDIAK